MPEVIPRYHAEGSLFIAIHRHFRRLHIVRSPGLHLHKAQHILLPSNQVNLTPCMRRAKVPRHHDIAVPAEIKVRILLSALTDSLVLGSAIRGKRVPGKPIQRTNRSVREPS